MRIEEIMRSASAAADLQRWLHLEQHANAGSPSGFSAIHQVAAPFRPGIVERFRMTAMRVPASLAESFLADPSPSLLQAIGQGEERLVCVHPEVAGTRRDHFPKVELYASPTAAGRTVLVEGISPYFAKLHYPKLLGRVNRRMSRRRVAGGCTITNELARLVNLNVLTTPFAYLPETYGIFVPASDSTEAIGVGYREIMPRPHVPTRRMLIPFFALFANDAKSPIDPPLVRQLFAVAHSADELFYRLVRILLESFRTLVLDAGLWPENHAQNILLEIDSEGEPLRIVHRDLYEFYADLEIRQARGLPVEHLDKRMPTDDFRFKLRSYLYDFKLGEYVLEPLVQAFTEFSGDNVQEIRRSVAEMFRSTSDDWKQMFVPYESMYKMPRVEAIERSGRPLIVPGGPPVFR